ncbi:MAG TPA: DUF3182 family protein [Candidimonas sp.]|nr:DUF3182 family protein [Candidimonas sp.]
MNNTTESNPKPVGGTVLVYAARLQEPEHERVVHFDIGRRIASLLGMDFGGLYEPERRYPGAIYYLPTETIIGQAMAESLGITSENDLFGGVAPHAFVPTKAISHGLIDGTAPSPEGWSPEFTRRTADSVLRGYTCFTLADARVAGARLLNFGALRIKPVHATGGRGQVLVSDGAQLDEALREIDTSRLGDSGVVLEEHLDDVKTYSVGQIRVAGIIASYVGTQRLTVDNVGQEVYGGSDLVIARGNFDALLLADLPEHFRVAVGKAQRYDQAANDCFQRFFASRRNYDVASGLDHAGQPRVGVLEQSWRVGGASNAEIAAVEVFHANPHIRMVRASTIELFGDHEPPPGPAVQVYRGEDDEIGLVSKYVSVEPYGNE